jgi:hypothetical protein
MKRPQPDIGDSLRNQFIGNLKTVRGLLRLWGTQTVDGVEVFTPRQYYHKVEDRSADFEKLFKFLGAYKSVTEANSDGLRSAWMYFNKNNGTDLTVNYDTYVAGNLNKMWWDPADGVMPQGLTLTTSIIIEGFSRNTVNNTRIQELLNTSMSESAAIASIQSNFEELWDITNITQEGVGVINKGSIVDPVNSITVPDEDDLTPDDPWLSTVARYALRNSSIPCNIKKVSIGAIQRNNTPNTQDFSTTYIVDIEIPYRLFTTGDVIVNSIAADLAVTPLSRSTNNIFTTRAEIKAMDTNDIEDDIALVTRSYDLWENQVTSGSALSSSLWFSFNGTWYLKAAPFRDPRAFGLTYRELSSYVLGLLDSGYKKKKIPWYKKLVAVVLVVVAFIVAFVPGAQGLSAVLISIAQAIVIASLVLTLAILAFAVLGMAEWASAFSEVSKWIEPLVMLATIVLIVTGLGEAIEGIKTAAEDAAKKAGEEYVEQSLMETLLTFAKGQATDFVDNIIKGALDVFSGNLTTNAAMSFNTKLMELVDTGLKLRLESINTKNRDLKTEYDKLVEENSRETDVLQGFAKVYAKPATADWSMYASTFDLPYERGGGNLSLGNIQRTTKQALRRADYDDSAFAGIFII